MIKIILIGKENVGKSSIFNYFTKKNYALVADIPGLTKDTQNIIFKLKNNFYQITDTYGFKNKLQTEKYLINLIKKNNIIFYIIDATIKINQCDIEIINYLTLLKKHVFLIINKIDLIDEDIIDNFPNIKNKNQFLISIKKEINISLLIKKLITLYDTTNIKKINHQDKLSKINIIGTPNSGKSTLINRLLNLNILKMNKYPGTTIDSIKCLFEKSLYLIDNPGIKKYKKNIIEYCIFSKTFETIKISDINILIIDFFKGITKTDIKILKFTFNLGKKILLVINKTENNNISKNKKIKKIIYNRYPFLFNIDIIFISAKFGIGIEELKNKIKKNLINKIQLNYSILDQIKKLLNSHHFTKNIIFKKIIIEKKIPVTLLLKITNKLNLNNAKIRFIMKEIIKIINIKNQILNIKFI